MIDDPSDFLDRMAAQFSAMGHSAVTGRVFAHLLTSPSEEHTADGMMSALGISRGSTSNALRALTESGLVERQPQVGTRRLHYRIPAGVWGQLMRRQARFIGQLSQLAGAGARLPDLDPDAHKRLAEMARFYARMAEEVPRLIARIEAPDEAGSP